MTTEDAEKALELALAHLNRTFGKGSVVRLGDAPQEKWPAIPTGSLGLDLALGIGGLPKGRIVEIYGYESSGKSTLCLSVIAEAQRRGGKCAFVDVEHAVDPVYAQNLKVDLDNLIFSQPDNAEEALDIVESLVSTAALDVIVVDSVAALVPKQELEGGMSDQQMGLLPRVMSKSMRKLVGKTAKAGTLLIFTNQVREKVGLVFGNPEVTPGGKALRFAASVRIELRKKEDIKDKATGDVIGLKTKLKVVKNKVGPPLRMTEMDIRYGRGIDRLGGIIDSAIAYGVLDSGKAGWIRHADGSVFAQGRENAIEVLASDLEMADNLLKQVLDAAG